MTVRSLILGLIGGGLLGGLLFMAVGAAYHAAMGLSPKPYRVFPS